MVTNLAAIRDSILLCFPEFYFCFFPLQGDAEGWILGLTQGRGSRMGLPLVPAQH